MNQIMRPASDAPVVPVARVPIAVRVATMADLPFMDALQKKHSKQLGYFPTKQFEGYIGQGAVLVADGLGYVIAKDRYLKRDEWGSCISCASHPGINASWWGHRS